MPTSAAAATTLALLEEYVILSRTADSSGQLYTRTGGKACKSGVAKEKNELNKQHVVPLPLSDKLVCAKGFPP